MLSTPLHPGSTGRRLRHPAAFTPPGGYFGELAPLSAASGAEWSLFCPAIGMAVDCCARVSLSLVRAALAAGSAAVAGVSTAAADGTELSPPVTGAMPDSTLTGARYGIGGAVGSLSQAVISSAAAHRAVTVIRVRMACPSNGVLHEALDHRLGRRPWAPVVMNPSRCRTRRRASAWSFKRLFRCRWHRRAGHLRPMLWTAAANSPAVGGAVMTAMHKGRRRTSCWGWLRDLSNNALTDGAVYARLRS